MSTFLLVPLGSHGDVHPFVGLGLALRRRGHRVRIIVNPYFGALVEQAGLELIPLGKEEDYTSLASDPRLWKPLSGPRRIFEGIGRFIRPVYDAIAAANEPGRTIVVGSTLALGARVAEEKLSIPTVTVHLQPVVLRSLIAPAAIPGMIAGAGVPRGLMRLQWWIIDNLVFDRLTSPALNGFRRELGLPPVRGILRQYIHSPRRVIGLFPEWFAPPQPDWPGQVRLTGFPLYDESGVTEMPAWLSDFLSEGSAPIAFTFGSAMWHAHALLRDSADACARLGRRGLLLTRHREQVPSNLPPGVRHVDFAPFGQLLPRCAALVHHGGIGTASQAMAAGTPQLILPHAHDQLDNATRIARLGIGRMMSPRRYTARSAAGALRALLSDKGVSENCRRIAARFEGVDSLGRTCELIEESAGSEGNAVSNLGADGRGRISGSLSLAQRGRGLG